MLEFKNLSVCVNGKTLLSGVSGHLKKGTFVGLYGANGSGKTTLLRTLAGLLPYKGNIGFLKKELNQWSLDKLSKQRSYFPVSPVCAWNVKAKDIFDMFKAPLLPEYTKLMDIDSVLNQPIITLSSGEKTRIFLAAILSREASVILLDEPLSHLDPVFKQIFLNHLRAQTKNNKTVLMSMHEDDYSWFDCVWKIKGSFVLEGTL